MSKVFLLNVSHRQQPKLILELPDDIAAGRTSAAHNFLFDMSTHVPVHKFVDQKETTTFTTSLPPNECVSNHKQGLTG